MLAVCNRIEQAENVNAGLGIKTIGKGGVGGGLVPGKLELGVINHDVAVIFDAQLAANLQKISSFGFLLSFAQASYFPHEISDEIAVLPGTSDLMILRQAKSRNYFEEVPAPIPFFLSFFCGSEIHAGGSLAGKDSREASSTGSTVSGSGGSGSGTAVSFLRELEFAAKAIKRCIRDLLRRIDRTCVRTSACEVCGRR